jgi:hypothetical protein
MRLFLSAGFVAVAAAAASLGVRSTAADDKATHSGHAAHFISCAKECRDCALMCDTCAAHCANLLAEGKKEHKATLETCQDCSAICTAAAAITAKAGPFADVICTACEEACKRCAAACDKHRDDEHMKKCAEQCRTCEKACREMLGYIGHGK